MHHEPSAKEIVEQRVSSAGKTSYHQQVNPKLCKIILPNTTVCLGKNNTSSAGLEDEQLCCSKDSKPVKNVLQNRSKGKVIQPNKRGERDLGTTHLKEKYKGDTTKKEKEKMPQKIGEVQWQNNKNTNNKKSTTSMKGGRGGNKGRH